MPKNFAELNVTDATQIAVGALSNITSLKKVTLNENNAKNKGILSVGAYAFYNLNQLEELTIPTSVKNIGEHVFEKCTGLQKLTVPYIGLDKDNYDDASSNEFCLWFGTEANAASNAVKQYTYKDSSSTSYYIPASLTEIVITNVKNLASYALYGMTQLTNVKIERNEYSTIDCASFGSYVFYGCTGLTTFAIPEKLETLGVSIFENCTGLQSVSSGNNFTTIGQRMFAGCTGLYNFDFKDHIEIIDDEAFYGCVNLGAKTLNELFPDKYQTTTESSSRVNSIELNKVTSYYSKAMNTKMLRKTVKKSTAYTAKGREILKNQAKNSELQSNPYSWVFEIQDGENLNEYTATFKTCGICHLMKELNLEEYIPAMCAFDYDMAKLNNTEFSRQYTLASGGPYCDCHYKHNGKIKK